MVPCSCRLPGFPWRTPLSESGDVGRRFGTLREERLLLTWKATVFGGNMILSLRQVFDYHCTWLSAGTFTATPFFTFILIKPSPTLAIICCSILLLRTYPSTLLIKFILRGPRMSPSNFMIIHQIGVEVISTWTKLVKQPTLILYVIRLYVLLSYLTC